MSRFRQGHLRYGQQNFGYLVNLPHGAIRYRMHEPDYSNHPHKEYDWARTVYSGTKQRNLMTSQNDLETLLHPLIMGAIMTW